jgi:hypothetical protein
MNYERSTPRMTCVPLEQRLLALPAVEYNSDTIRLLSHGSKEGFSSQSVSGGDSCRAELPRRAQHHPKRLGEKLRQIHDALELSQNEMLKRLDSPDGILGISISGSSGGCGSRLR